MNLKNNFKESHLKIEESHPIPSNQNEVHKAKAHIIIAPDIKFQDEIAYVCIARVKPQGKKNVKTQTKKLLFFELIFFQKNFGSVIFRLDNLGNRPVNHKPKYNIINAEKIVNNPIIFEDI